jgi:hypothetical protein
VTRRSRFIRSVWLAFAALQLVLPGAAALADASLDIAGAHERAHIESHSTAACARVHPADCALCRFLTTALVAGAATTIPTSDAAPRSAPTIALSHPAGAVVLLPRSRAPPLPA